MIFPYITTKNICINQLLLCILTVTFLSIIKNLCTKETEKGILFLIFLFLVNPSSISFLFYWGNYGRFDLFMICGAIICSILLIKKRFLWVIPIICVVGIMTHQGFTFAYFPYVLLMLLFYVIKYSRGKIILAVTFVGGCIAFLYFQFYGKIDDMSLNEVLNIMASRTDYPKENMTVVIKSEYYTNIFDFIPIYVLPPLKQNIVKIILTIIFLIPLEYVLFHIWKEFVKETSKKYFWILPVFIIIATLPEFILTCDYGRNFASIFISQFLLIFTFFAMGSETMKTSLKNMQQNVIRNPFGAMAALIEWGIIGKFEAANILDITDNMYKMLQVIF